MPVRPTAADRSRHLLAALLCLPLLSGCAAAGIAAATLWTTATSYQMARGGEVTIEYAGAAVTPEAVEALRRADRLGLWMPTTGMDGQFVDHLRAELPYEVASLQETHRWLTAANLDENPGAYTEDERARYAARLARAVGADLVVLIAPRDAGVDWDWGLIWGSPPDAVLAYDASLVTEDGHVVWSEVARIRSQQTMNPPSAREISIASASAIAERINEVAQGGMNVAGDTINSSGNTFDIRSIF